LAQRERDEIAVIEIFLPRQLDDYEIETALAAVVGETGAAGMKDMGRVMGCFASATMGSSISPGRGRSQSAS
jgi:uncharacterized protein